MDVIQAIKERRSINFFEAGREIPDDKLMELLKIANLSPSSFNLQPWRVIVVRDPERKKVLRQCAFNQPKVEEASTVLIMIADPGGVEENLERVLDSWQKFILNPISGKHIQKWQKTSTNLKTARKGRSLQLKIPLCLL